MYPRRKWFIYGYAELFSFFLTLFLSPYLVSKYKKMKLELLNSTNKIRNNKWPFNHPKYGKSDIFCGK